MNFLTSVLSSVPLRWWMGTIVSAVALAAKCLRPFESEEIRAKRAERNNSKKMRALAERISSYGCAVQRRYPTGDVIVSEADLAKQLGKSPDAVAKALNVLCMEQKVQRATLRGYWKLNVQAVEAKRRLSIAANVHDR